MRSNGFKSLQLKKSNESWRYLRNAQETLAKIPVEYGLYKDKKYVAEACGMCHLAAIRAIENFLLGKKVPSKNLPDDVHQIRQFLKRYTNGKDRGDVLTAFNIFYETIHKDGYYGDEVTTVKIKLGFDNALWLISRFCSNGG